MSILIMIWGPLVLDVPAPAHLHMEVMVDITSLERLLLAVQRFGSSPQHQLRCRSLIVQTETSDNDCHPRAVHA